MAAMGGALVPFKTTTFARSSGNILTATGHGLQTGSGPYKCTTTSVTDLPSGLTAAIPSTTFATGSSVIADDTVTIGSDTYTFKASPSAANEVDVGGSDAASMENLARAINGGPGAGTDYSLGTTRSAGVTAESRGATLVVTAKSLDAAIGDAIDVDSTGGTITWDSANLEGGASGTDYWLIRLDDDTFSLAASYDLAIAGTAVALSDAGTGIHSLVRTVETLAEAIELAVTRITSTGTRALPQADNIANVWQSLIDGFAD